MPQESPDPRTMPKTAGGYRDAWALVEQTWAATVADALELPPDVLRTRVEGEWSFVETLRHLIFATDSWARRTILGDPAPFYAGGIPHDEAVREDGIDVTTWGIDPAADPPLEEVFEVRSARMGDVRRIVDALTPDELDRVCAANASPGNPENTQHRVGACLDVVINEEWCHHGYVVRDLATLRSHVGGEKEHDVAEVVDERG